MEDQAFGKVQAGSGVNVPNVGTAGEPGLTEASVKTRRFCDFRRVTSTDGMKTNSLTYQLNCCSFFHFQ